MTKAELIEKIARSRELPPDITKKCIQQILEIAFAELAAYFVRARVTRTQSPRFTFPGFGTFTKKKRSARKGVNPRTLQPMTIDAAYTLDFKPGVELRSSLNGPPGKTAQPGRKRGRAAAQLELDHAPFTAPATPGPAEEDEDGALILRRRFTARDDLIDDLDDLDDDLDDASIDALLEGEVAENEALHDLPPAPMQRARVPGVRASRTGSR